MLCQNINAYNGFLIQLQWTDYNSLLQSVSDVLIIDFQDSALTRDQINALQLKWKKVLSYLSIWEAENYRTYWLPEWNIKPPSFIVGENPNWPWNYPVKFWDASWKNIIYRQLSQIMSLGYDWVYLDTIDSYRLFDDIKARDQMILFVNQISLKGKERAGFMIIVQNATELLLSKAYKSAIDWVWVESLWFTNSKHNSLQNIKYIQNNLKWFLVFSIEYLQDNKIRCQYIRNAKVAWYLPFIWNHNLDNMGYSASCH